MKKWFLMIMCCALAAASLFGCASEGGEGAADQAAEGAEAPDADGEGEESLPEGVTLGEYKGLEVTIDGDYDVDEEDVDEYLDSLISYYGIYGKSDEKVVGDTSIVNADYTGYQDNQPFDGGSAKNQNINVAESGYIKGFAEALIGHKVGETFRENVTFPEDYGVEALNGQTVQFEYKINYICDPVSCKDLTDDMVKEYMGKDSVAALREELKSSLITERENSRVNDTRVAVIRRLLEVCTVNIPEDVLKERIDENIASYKADNLKDGETLEDYLDKYYGMTYDEFYQQQEEIASGDLTLELICQEIASAENITATEDEYKEYIADMVEASGLYEDETELYEAYRTTAAAGEDYFRHMLLSTKVVSFVTENANIQEK